MVESTQELNDAIYRDRVLQVRRMPPKEKLCVAGDLFDEVCERMRDDIRLQFPGVDESLVEEILRERLDIARRLERLT